MDPAHHLDRSQHYINKIPVNIADGDFTRAAKAVGRAASHAVTAAAVHWGYLWNGGFSADMGTAAAVHWGYPHKSRRRLTSVLHGLLSDGKIIHADTRTFRQVYDLPKQVAAAESESEARRLCKAIANAVNGLPPDRKPPRPRYRVKVYRAPDGRPLSPLEIAAINRPELLGWIDKWNKLCGEPPPPKPPPPQQPDWPNPPSLSGESFRWPVPVD